MKIRPAIEQDLIELSAWFLTESEAKVWRGPSIHFPLILEQLKVDIKWDVAQSYALVDGGDNLLGFAQVLNKFGYKHLAGIAVSPKKRGRKLGYKLMTELLNLTATNDVNFSLFVYVDNTPAINLYEKIGFEIRSHADGQPKLKGCIFMVKETQQIVQGSVPHQ